MSYENFRKKFSQHVGESPGHFQKRRRIEHACAAIYQGTHSFKALADELGFCDVFHFSKTFRQVVGETPKEFRAKAQGT
jgi:AraC-like DNA-binding protein